MFTRITTILTAATLSLGTAFADPALARDRSDNANLLGGLIVGGLIGAAIANDNNDNDRHGRGHVSRGHNDDHHAGHGRGQGRGHNKGYGHAKRVNLPGACRVYNGHRSGYSGRCLRGYDYGHAALPSACAVHVGGHHRTIYRDRCLNQYGYY